MNTHDRDAFNGAITLILRGLGDEVGGRIRRGLNHFRDLETEYSKLKAENESLKARIAALEKKETSTGNASTETIAFPTGACCKNGKDSGEKLDPQPQTPGDGSGVSGAALVRDEDKIKTDVMPIPTVTKRSFFSRLFGE